MVPYAQSQRARFPGISGTNAPSPDPLDHVFLAYLQPFYLIFSFGMQMNVKYSVNATQSQNRFLAICTFTCKDSHDSDAWLTVRKSATRRVMHYIYRT